MYRCYVLACALLLLCPATDVWATPFFARTYGFPCQTCHSGFPRLNEFGLAFKANNFRIPGAEKTSPLLWQKTLPLAAQVKPTLMRLHPGATKVQFTDTQLLAGGLLSPTTALYLHHTYFVDGRPVDFPSYELWVQQVLSERDKIMLKIGQFELPHAYSPEINRTTVLSPSLFGAGLLANDVRLGPAMTGLQLSGIAAKQARWYLAYGAPNSLTTGTLIGDRQFFGRFRDLYLRVATAELIRQVGVFAYFTHPTRSRTDPRTEHFGRRYGLDGTLFWRDFQMQAAFLYGENSDPRGTGKKGTLRSAFFEIDRLIRPWLGVTGRWDIQNLHTTVGRSYTDIKTLSLRIYPYEKVKLVAEYQDGDHGRSASAFLASISF